MDAAELLPAKLVVAGVAAAVVLATAAVAAGVTVAAAADCPVTAVDVVCGGVRAAYGGTAYGEPPGAGRAACTCSCTSDGVDLYGW